MSSRFLLGTLFTVFIVCIGFASYCFIFKDDSSAVVLTIYHTNDVHGALDSVYDESGKLTQIGVDVIKSLKDHTKNAILLDAGDFSQGKILANRTRGQKACEFMKMAGYDAMTLGNHEFDEGVQNLLSNISKSKIDVFSCNVFRKEKDEMLLRSQDSNGDHKIIEICGKKIGIFGVTTKETVNSTSKENTENLVFKDEIEQSKKQVYELKNQKCDLIIAMAHVGDEEAVTSFDIASLVEGIDIIIDGHSHKVCQNIVGRTHIVQTGIYSSHIGKLEIKFKKDAEPQIFSKMLDPSDLQDPSNPMCLGIFQDQKIKKQIDKELEIISKVNNEVVGYTQNTIYGGNFKGTNISRRCGCSLGSLVADAVLHNTNRNLRINNKASTVPVVSIMNGGGIRASISRGKITFADILNAVPFKNRTIAKIVTPKKLYQILENGVKNIKFESDGVIKSEETAFPNVAGMRIVVDPKSDPCEIKNGKLVKEGSKIKEIHLLTESGEDRCFLKRDDDDTKIIVSSPDFVANGGDGYVSFKGAEVLEQASNLFYIYDMLKIYMECLMAQNGEVSGHFENKNRVKILNYTSNKNFDCSIKVLLASRPLKNTKVFLRVDDQNPCVYITDENGNLNLYNISQGDHNISVSYKNLTTDSYVNNLLGVNSFEADLKISCLDEKALSVLKKNKNNANFNKISNNFWWMNETTLKTVLKI